MTDEVLSRLRSGAALLAELTEIGRDPVSGGYSRHLLEPAELAMREWFTRRAADLGLTVETDGNTNLWAWWGVPGPDAVVIGSHLDSVPGGGAFDGPLGVVSGLAAVAALKDEGFVPSKPCAVVVFAEEEGSRFGLACLGSGLSSGVVDPARALALRDREGVTMAAALNAAGFDPSDVGPDLPRMAHVGVFVELHVEQGRYLADGPDAVALATSILAHGRWRLRFTGTGNHAGTTPMSDRQDPVVAAAETIADARQLSVQSGQGATGLTPRATVGRVRVVPGGTNVIASIAELWLDVRAEQDAAARLLVAQITTAANVAADREGCRFEVTEESFAPQVVFDAALADRLARVLDHPPRIPTGAGHDAGVLSAMFPTAMLFVRNPTGISHAPSESATDGDVERGVAAMAAVLRELL